MKNLFSYDSKLVSVLSHVGDLFLLNLLYIVCCMPIFTIGAAQAGLHTAIRILNDPMEDSSPYKAFFRGFASGFFKITGSWLIVGILQAIVGYTLWISFTYREEGLFVHWAIPLVVLFLLCCYQSVLSLFHSRFGCTLPQLLYNCLLMMIWHPLASLLTGILFLAPLLVFLVNTNLFIDITPVFLTLYYSIICSLIRALTNKAFKALIDNFNNPEGDKQEVVEESQEALPEAEEETVEAEAEEETV